MNRNAPVAQLDRALPSEGKGHTFESCRVRQQIRQLLNVAKPNSGRIKTDKQEDGRRGRDLCFHFLIGKARKAGLSVPSKRQMDSQLPN